MNDRRRFLVGAIAIALVAASQTIASAGPHDHHGHEPACHPTAEQKREAAEFARETIAKAQKYELPIAALGDYYMPFADINRAITHYINYENYWDWTFLDPDHPEALVYANTHTGQKLIGVMYALQDDMEPPDMGGCITQWHTHPMCTTAFGYRHIWEGECPPGWTSSGRSENMLHVWTVAMKGGPYAHSPDPEWYCWPKPRPC